MSGFKRQIDEVRDEGTEAFFKGVFRTSNPKKGTELEVYWYEGWDFANDFEAKRVEQLDGYAERQFWE